MPSGREGYSKLAAVRTRRPVGGAPRCALQSRRMNHSTSRCRSSPGTTRRWSCRPNCRQNCRCLSRCYQCESALAQRRAAEPGCSRDRSRLVPQQKRRRARGRLFQEPPVRTPLSGRHAFGVSADVDTCEVRPARCPGGRTKGGCDLQAGAVGQGIPDVPVQRLHAVLHKPGPSGHLLQAPRVRAPRWRPGKRPSTHRQTVRAHDQLQRASPNVATKSAGTI